MRLSKKNSEGTYLALIAAAALFFFIYEVLRAFRASITIDEAATYLSITKNGLLSLFDFNEANNHLVNRALVNICAMIGGGSEFILRLPNVLGYILYLVFSFLLLHKFTGRMTAFLGFLLLNTNPYLMDFFSLCRGYGLSLGFLTTSLYFFAAFLSTVKTDSPAARRALTWSLGMSAAAVLGNFTQLDVYFSLLFISVLVFVLINIKAKTKDRLPPPSLGPASRVRKKAVVLLIIAAAVFNLFVLSQDPSLSDRLYAPVTVRIPGLAAANVNEVVVKGFDQKRREQPFVYRNSEWSLGPDRFLTYLHFKIPGSALANVREIEIRIGDRTFRYEGQELRRRLNGHPNLFLDSPPAMSLKRAALPLFASAINWRGELNHLLQIASRFLWLVLIFALTIAVVHAAGRLLVRKNIIDSDQFRRLAFPTLALGGFIAYPLYILKTSGEFYWGREQGLIRDTWTTLVDNSFYGTLYTPRQNLYVGLACFFFGLVFVLTVYVHARKKTLSKLVPGALFPAVILLVSASIVLQRLLFKNPFPIGRTALFFIPLFAYFVIFSLANLGEAGRAARAVSLSLLAVVTLASAAHFFGTANTAMAVEWRFDADTKQLMSDLPRIKAELDPKTTALRLGVDWIFLPSLTYYQQRDPLSWLDFRSTDDRPENDLYYLHESFDPARMILIKNYPVSGNILVRAKDSAR